VTCKVQTFRKDPDATLDYGFDWEAPADEGGPYLESAETISASVWTVPDGLTEVSDEADDTTTKVWISGGTAGNSYTVSNKITTSEGRIDERSFVIIVGER
jgi:hypothetical protein